MEVIPAVDIQKGRAVRLQQGDFNKQEVYGDNPVATARHWENKGARRLHVVDLDGARAGEPQNGEIIKNLVETLSIPVQVGGGIRRFSTVKEYLEWGVDRVIVGTIALEKPELVVRLVAEYGSGKIVAGIDAREGKVAVRGWQETSTRDSRDVILELKEMGLRTFIYTDISRDGMLRGPDITGLEKLAVIPEIEIIASGGITNRRDLDRLCAIGIESAIVGKALYTGDFDYNFGEGA